MQKLMEKLKLIDKITVDLWMRLIIFNSRENKVEEEFLPFDADLIRDLDERHEFNSMDIVYIGYYRGSLESGFKSIGLIG